MEVTIISGETREFKPRLVRSFARYLTPTGKILPITQCPYFKPRLESSLAGSRYQYSKRREVSTVYEVTMPTTVVVTFDDGARYGRLDIPIEVSEHAPGIRLEGFSGFGLFSGRGKILRDISALLADGVITLTMTQPEAKPDSAGSGKKLMIRR